MKARYQFRFYPTDQQRQSLVQLFGCVRVVGNNALAFSKSSKYQWLNRVSSALLQQSLKQLEVANKTYFDSLKGKRKGGTVGQPRFKKKTNDPSATLTKATFSIQQGGVFLAKIGNLDAIWSRDLLSEPSSVTAIQDYTNRYFFSVVVEMQPVQVDTINQSIRIDLGTKPFAMMSDGSKAESPNYSKHVRKMRKLQKTVVDQQKGSNWGNNTQIQIAKQHNRMVDIRDGWEPRSQICLAWGFKWGKLNLKVWSVRCLNCGTEQNREENAAKNIESSRHRALGDSKRTQRQSKTTSVASVSEASRITVASAR